MLFSALLSGAAAAGGAAPALRVALPTGPGVVRGFDRDLFAAVAAELGVAFAAEDAPAADGLRLLDGGEVDVAAGPYASAAAGARLLLRPVAPNGEALLKRRGDGALLKPIDASGKRVAPLPGAAGPARGARGLGAAVSASPAGPADPYADLAAGRVAALVGSVEAVAAAALARPDAVEVVGPPFGAAAPLAPAMRPGDPRARAVAEAIERLRSDGRLAGIQRRWFGLAVDSVDAAR